MSNQSDQKNIKTNFNSLPVDLLENITHMTPVKIYQPLLVKAYINCNCDKDDSELLLNISKDGDDYVKIDNGLIFHEDDFKIIIEKILTSKLRSWMDTGEVHIQISIGDLSLYVSHFFEGLAEEYMEDLMDELMPVLEDHLPLLQRVWKWSK